MDDSLRLEKVEKAIDEQLAYYRHAAHDYSKNIRDDKPETRIHSAHLWGHVSALDYLSRHIKYLRSVK